MSHEAAPTKNSRSTSFQKCKFCRDWVNLDDEGTQYADGSAAHESCDDSDQYARANEADFRD